MRIQYIIYLGAAGGALYARGPKGYGEVPVGRDGGADALDLVAALLAERHGPVAVLVDVIDEEHVRDVAPRVGRRDQQALLARKVARAFPRTPFRTTQVQGRNPRNPDEERVLFTALTRPGEVRALLDRLAAAHIPVAGVFSPALLARHLLDEADRTADAVLLATRQGDGSVRHSFFRQGQLAGSRLLRQASPAADGQRALRQIEESLRYFDPAYSPGAAEPLRLRVRKELAASLEAAGGHEGWSVVPFDLAAACARARVRGAVPADRAELAWVELLGRHAGAGNLAPPEDRRYFDFFRMRSFARVAWVAVAGLAIAGTLVNGTAIVEAEQRLELIGLATERLQAVLPLQEEEPSGPVDPLEMQQAVAAFTALEAHQLEPGAILGRISAALGAQPRIQLDAIQWTAEAPAAAAVAVAEGEEAPADGDEPEAVPQPEAVTITLRGQVRPFNGDFPDAFAQVEAFRAAVAAAPGVSSVRAVAQPLDVRSTSTLSGEVARGTHDVQAPFALEVVMRFGNDPA